MVNEPSSGASTSVSESGTGDLPPGYVWAYQQAMPPLPPRKRTSRVLIVVATVWAAALLVSGVIYSLHGGSTVREQSTIVGAGPVVDRSIIQIASAAGTVPIVAITGFTKVGDCKITPVRSGVNYERTIALYTAPGTESALLHRIATGLPASYGAQSGPGAILDLYADAGDYVALTGTAPSPGSILVKAATGCRDTGGTVAGMSAPDLAAAEMAPIRTVLTALGVQPSSTAAAQVSCGSSGGVLRTVSAHVPPSQEPGPLDAALASLAADSTVHSPNLIAYRSGGVDMAVAQDSTGLTISATTTCQ